jgi:hypothetical protein
MGRLEWFFIVACSCGGNAIPLFHERNTGPSVGREVGLVLVVPLLGLLLVLLLLVVAH